MAYSLFVNAHLQDNRIIDDGQYIIVTQYITNHHRLENE